MPKNKNRSHKIQNKPRAKVPKCKTTKAQRTVKKIHLGCASLWPTTWHPIQPAVDGNIQDY